MNSFSFGRFIRSDIIMICSNGKYLIEKELTACQLQASGFYLQLLICSVESAYGANSSGEKTSVHLVTHPLVKLELVLRFHLHWNN